MTIKKTLLTTSSCFLISAILLSQIYSFATQKNKTTEINFSAFANLAANVQEISKTENATTLSDETTVTNDIINVINKELTQKIKQTRYAVRMIKPKIIIEEKAIVAVVEVTKPNELFSEYEINNKGLIDLYAYSVESVEYSKFENMAISSSYEATIKDEVVVAQASTQESVKEITAPIEADEVKTIQPAPERNVAHEEAAIKEAAKDEEMVMFDYSDKLPKAKTIDQQLYERPISNTVKQAISREIGNSPVRLASVNTQQKAAIAETTKIENQEIDLDSPDNTIYDYTNNTKKQAVSDLEKEVSAFMAPPILNTHETQFILRAKEINLSTHKSRSANAFEFVPDYDRAERLDDQTSGEIAIAYSLSGEMNTQTGIVQAQGMIPTRVELNLGVTKGIEVPLINEEGIQKFLVKQGLSIEGNLLMVALDASIVDTEIDSRFAQRFYFNQNFKPQTNAAGASYVLYAGVKTGNILIRYLLNNKEVAQKIVYVGDGEMYYEDPSFSKSERETFTFTTRSLLGQKKKELVIDGNAISYFNTTNTAKKKTLNAYEVKVPTLANGMRKYLEFKHLKDSVFVGSWNEKDIEIPGNDFIGKVLEMNQISSLKERCVVQVNLSKDLREFKANGKNRSGEMFVETSFLDKDGNFSKDSSELAEKAFIVGDMEGLMNVKLDYTDGSTEFLKTFCSEGTYLVEQL